MARVIAGRPYRGDMTSSGSRAITALAAAGSLVGGFAVAQVTGVRALGGVVLLAGAASCGRRWWRTAGPAPALLAGTTYAMAFVVSHPLAKAIGAWPSVLAVSAGTAAVAYAVTAPRARA